MWFSLANSLDVNACAGAVGGWLPLSFTTYASRWLTLLISKQKQHKWEWFRSMERDMVQTNLIYKTQRKVARLPKHLFSQGGQDRSQNMTLSHTVCPPQWDQSALPDIGFKLVQLSYTSQEYGKIKKLFEKTMKDYCILQLQRIQNPALWQVFQWQKEQMKKLNKSKWVDERLLFHGTSLSHVSAICEQNFDWRICGTHGTMYGKGSYFARDASYSHEYCSSHNGRYSMFVAHVLVGDFVQGNPEYLRPPPRASNSNRLYDSCVDDPTDPSIFVIFEKHQIYPAYIVEYSSEAQCRDNQGYCRC
ncbi:protein mono-ADP-ribosyltransferase PARP12-like isoform 4-T8 [Theristicus caerulescens]